MTMFREALIWIVLLIFNLINTFLVLVGKSSLFKVPLWSTWLVWGIVTIIIVGILLFRKHLQKSIHALINVSIIIKILKGEFFVQMPLYIIENQSNVIYGNETITYKPVFVNRFHKLLSLFGIQTKYSLYMTSSENNVKVIRTNVVANRPQYTMYLNNEEVGTLEMKQFFKSGESNNKFLIRLITNLRVFDVSSPFLVMKRKSHLRMT